MHHVTAAASVQRVTPLGTGHSSQAPHERRYSRTRTHRSRTRARSRPHQRVPRSRASGSDFASKLPWHVVPLGAELARLALVPMREDPQQEVRPRRRIVRALDHERWTPARVELLADLGLLLREVEALFVP